MMIVVLALLTGEAAVVGTNHWMLESSVETRKLKQKQKHPSTMKKTSSGKHGALSR